MRKKRYYFAYGSNMLFERIRQRIGNPNKVKTCTLRGWKLLMNCGFPNCAYANIVQTFNDNDFVEGVLFDIGWWQETILDECEAVPFNYVKEELISAEGDRIFAYVATKNFAFKGGKEGKALLWYVNILLDACIENKFQYTYNKLLDYKKKFFNLKKGNKHKSIKL